MITSKDNDLIKYCKQIKDKKYSKENNECLVETYKIVSELLSKNLIKEILVTPNKSNLFDSSKIKINVISDNIARFLSDAINNDGVFGVAYIPKYQNKISKKSIILDGLQDPSNIGAIIRSARAFGFDRIFAVDTVYPYTFKCIRSSMSYIFDIDYKSITISELIDIKKTQNIKFICADMHGENLDNVNFPSENFAIIIGNEGHGVSKELKNLADYTLSIPMQNNVESLNASVSASILMYTLKN